MTMHVNPKELAQQRSLPDIIAEYEAKALAMKDALGAVGRAISDLQMNATVAGVYGQTHLKFDVPCERTLHEHLLKSAWLHVYAGCNIDRLSSAKDKDLWKQKLEKLPPLTLENIKELFGAYLLNPRSNILRGLAEAFCDLDPAYKSHDKVKIGVKGLPKRVILSNLTNYSGWGRNRLHSILNALAAYQGKPLVEYAELLALLDDENALLETRVIQKPQRYGAPDLIPVHARGVRLRRFDNGNGHLFFEPDTLRDINKALAEYYGEVLPDCSEEKPSQPRAGTAVSKDLQYYPTPAKVVDDVVSNMYQVAGKNVLEPSCGCGRFLDALRKAGANVYGIEVDFARAAQARAKGHSVLHANFLETVPTADFDFVVMNPPFYGKHYAKHVEHALKFLKPGGTLYAILPATARYDHGALDHVIPKDRYSSPWRDLPVGSFSESGTNINTTVLTIRKAG